ncbi:hypothetical protein [Altererythrobacter fulvus]|uniref:hypothetical protein n=1 Tax=Caenibius fulvus TaxID=2126012 RepID=UPI0030163CA0
MIGLHLNDTARHVGDALSVGWLVAVFLANLPSITAVLVLIWTVMRLYETWLSIRQKLRELNEEEIRK